MHIDDKNTTINRLRCLLNSEKHAYKMNSSRQLIPWRAVKKLVIWNKEPVYGTQITKLHQLAGKYANTM